MGDLFFLKDSGNESNISSTSSVANTELQHHDSSDDFELEEELGQDLCASGLSIPKRPEHSESSDTDEESGLETTQSNVKKATIRERSTDKWICIFQITGALEIQGENQGTIGITDTSEIQKIDNYLNGFFQAYNEHAKDITKKNYKVIQVLGSQYFYHSENKIISGSILVVGNGMTTNLQLNCHLLLEKFSQRQPLRFHKFHNVYIGHTYPVHSKDVVCIGGNSLRSLLQNWIDEQFFKRLHWIIPPTSAKMSNLTPLEAEAKEKEELLEYEYLIERMKENVLKEQRISIEPCGTMTSTPANPIKRRRHRPHTQINSMYEYAKIVPGREYPVKSHHWQTIEVPLNKDGTINDRAHRMAVAIRQKDGVVRKE